MMGKPNPATERRLKLIEFLSDVLTSEHCPIDANDFAHFRLVAGWYGGSEMLDRLAASYDDWPVVKSEVLLAVAVEALNRLIK